MKTKLLIVILTLACVGFAGCVGGGSWFVGVAIDYPSEALRLSEGKVVVTEISAVCREAALEPREPMVSDPRPGDAYVVFRTVGDKEPIIWVTIYRPDENRVSVVISTLEENYALEAVRSLRSAIEARMRAIAQQQGRTVTLEQHGMSIFH